MVPSIHAYSNTRARRLFINSLLFNPSLAYRDGPAVLLAVSFTPSLAFEQGIGFVKEELLVKDPAK